MGLSLIAYPKLIFVQSAEPSDKTQGLLWVDTDDNSLSVANGTSYSSVGGFSPKIQEIYVGAGFDIASATTNNHELTAITAGDLAGADYIKIDILSMLSVDHTNGYANATIGIDVKETGGAYGAVLAVGASSGDAINALQAETSSRVTTRNKTTWIHTLTAGEKTNGCQIRINSQGGEADSVVTNIQTSLTLLG